MTGFEAESPDSFGMEVGSLDSLHNEEGTTLPRFFVVSPGIHLSHQGAKVLKSSENVTIGSCAAKCIDWNPVLFQAILGQSGGGFFV